MPFCSHCGARLADGAQFCSACGARVSVAQQNPRERVQSYAGEVRKCPACLSEIPAMTAVCPSCGHQLVNARSSSAVSEFAEKLQAIENARQATSSGLFGVMLGKDYFSPVNKTDSAKINLIKTFGVPNTVEDILEFIVLAVSNIDVSALKLFPFGVSMQEFKAEKALTKAWITKMEQIYQKGKLSFGSNAAFKKVQEIYETAQVEIKKRKKRNRIIVGSIVTVFVLFYAAIFIGVGISGA